MIGLFYQLGSTKATFFVVFFWSKTILTIFININKGKAGPFAHCDLVFQWTEPKQATLLHELPHTCVHMYIHVRTNLCKVFKVQVSDQFFHNSFGHLIIEKRANRVRDKGRLQHLDQQTSSKSWRMRLC